jgi:hypothetical protein
MDKSGDPDSLVSLWQIFIRFEGETPATYEQRNINESKLIVKGVNHSLVDITDGFNIVKTMYRSNDNYHQPSKRKRNTFTIFDNTINEEVFVTKDAIDTIRKYNYFQNSFNLDSELNF